MKCPYMLVQKLSEQLKIHIFIPEDARGINHHYTKTAEVQGGKGTHTSSHLSEGVTGISLHLAD